MYSNSNYESDLINSYSWDTAIIFIEKYSEGNSNYANKTSVNTSKLTTGKAGDAVCNIHDMASNCWEWSTEHSIYTFLSSPYSYVYRGGYCYNTTNYTAIRDAGSLNTNYNYLSFRSVIY